MCHSHAHLYLDMCECVFVCVCVARLSRVVATHSRLPSPRVHRVPMCARNARNGMLAQIICFARGARSACIPHNNKGMHANDVRRSPRISVCVCNLPFRIALFADSSSRLAPVISMRMFTSSPGAREHAQSIEHKIMLAGCLCCVCVVCVYAPQFITTPIY